MSEGFKRSSKYRTNSPHTFFLKVTQHIQVAMGSIYLDIAAVFDSGSHGGFMEIRCNLRKRNFKEPIKAQFFLQAAVFAIKTVFESSIQFTRERQSQRLKRIFHQGQDHPLLQQYLPVTCAAIFLALKSTSQFQAQSRVPHRSESS